jgi:predicted transcriptional regulator YheO
MACWIEHTSTTWIIEDKARHVVAYVCCNTKTNLYSAHKHDKNLGYYASLEAAQCAAQPHIAKTKPTKTLQDAPWDS